MENQYKNPHEMAPEQMIQHSEKYHAMGNYGAAFFYSTIAKNLEGVIEPSISNNSEESFSERAKFVMHHSWTLLD